MPILASGAGTHLHCTHVLPYLGHRRAIQLKLQLLCHVAGREAHEAQALRIDIELQHGHALVPVEVHAKGVGVGLGEFAHLVRNGA